MSPKLKSILITMAIALVAVAIAARYAPARKLVFNQTA